MKQTLVVSLLALVAYVKSPNQEHPKVLYNENCGWAISKGYHYPSKPHIYIVTEDKDTIRFWSEKTKQKFKKKKDAKKDADMFWSHWHGDDHKLQ